MNDFIEEAEPRSGIADYDRDEATVMTGMTFDEYGEPFDYMKQVLTSFDIAETLEGRGVDSEVKLLVADNFVEMNQGEDGLSTEEVGQYADQRAAYLEAIADVYSGDYPVSVEMTSELKDDEFRQDVEALGERVEEDENFAELLLGAVPDEAVDPDATDRENTAYTREEIVTIMATDTDIKVGPKREKKYDLPAQLDDVRQLRDVDPLTGVYVTNSYPVDMESAQDQLDEEDWHAVQEFGVTPYKAGSKGLDPEDHRVLLTDDREDIARKVDEAPGQLRYDLEAFKRMTRDPEEPPEAHLATALDHEFREIQDALFSTYDTE
ncbi:MAG: hypothetical protein ABEJ98_01510 [Candidatus Nanohaloarchaea archaeon]